MKRIDANSSAGPSSHVDPRWIAVTAKDSSADGKFVYSVSSTGVYCRPSCPSKIAKRENVDFHPNPEAAERAGYRACRRCSPDTAGLIERQAAMIAAACRTIEKADRFPSVADLAGRAALSQSHFHRVFKETTGLTPKSYANAVRGRRVRKFLAGQDSVTSAVYDSGFNSSGRFYGESDALLGMTPSQYRSGGDNSEIKFAVGECSLGSILVAASTKGVCAVLLGDDPDSLAQDLHNRFPRADLIGGDALFERVVAIVVGFVEAPAVGLNLPLDIRGTAFQQRVWQALRKVPAGTTASYAEIAAAIGSPQSVRAVSQACGANAIAVAIPCHRIVRKGGDLSGYRWGVERKRKLLKKERAA